MSGVQIWRVFLWLQIFNAVLLATAEDKPRVSDGAQIDDSILAQKRYIAAMAKNGRLPKFAGQDKRDSSSEANDDDKAFDQPSGLWVDEKRHLGAFLRSHGKPVFGSPVESRRSSYEDSNYVEEDMDKADKRNVASLARLGKLNAARLTNFQPYGNMKRVNVYTLDDFQNDGLADDCDDDEEEERSTNNEDNAIANWMPSMNKRYIAALARTGRLPSWHPQRMWGGSKRDMPNAYWLRFRSGARLYGNQPENTNLDASRHLNMKRCKKNLSMLARKGKLPI